jgi:hypothetical protein
MRAMRNRTLVRTNGGDSRGFICRSSCAIRIDDYLFDHWEHERKADVVRKVVGDFGGWDKDAVKYDKVFDKLLKGLQVA